MVDAKVLIGVLTGEYARRADFYDYMNMLKKPANTYMIYNHDRSPAHGRNMIVDEAFKYDCTHVLFIDDDQAFKEDALTKLLEHDVDIVSGLYLKRAYPHQPLIFDSIDEEGRALFSYLNGSEQRLKPIEAAGFGWLLVKTDVFRKMERPYVRLGELDAEQWCDDIGFFNRVKQLGIKAYCDTECRIGHIGTMIVWPNKLDDGRWCAGYDTGVGCLNTPLIGGPIESTTYKFEK